MRSPGNNSSGRSDQRPCHSRGFGTPAPIRATAERLGLRLSRIERHTFPKPIDDNPRAAFDTVINYGCAEPGQTAPSDLRASIFDTYADLHRAACRAGDSGDAILLGRCQLPELPPG
jgi:hypothetical protein